VHVRPARADDYEAVVHVTEDTWDDRGGDYIPRVYRDWIEGEGADDGDRRTLVLDARDPSRHAETASPGDVAAIVQVVLLSPYEAWLQGMRVAPDYRRRGLATRLTHAAFGWARERGATVARNMVHSWNAASVGLSRRAGFDAGIEFRWVRPAPDADAGAAPDLRVTDDADAGWAFWTDSDARTALAGLALDAAESWAASELTRERLHAAADDGRLFVVRGDGTGTRALSLRNRTYTVERTGEGERTCAEYAVGAWADPDAAAALLAAVARDAAAEGADETRVPIPEGVRWLGDAAASGADLAEEPTFVLAADLTAREEWAGGG
jgi:GNAT superfamily N-acetyltransferase